MVEQAVKRIFVEKKSGFDIEAQSLLQDLRENLGIKGLEGLRVINRYDIAGITSEEYEQAKYTIFAEPPVDLVYDEHLDIPASDRVFAIEYLPGQYDQRADFAAQCVQILTQKERPEIATAKVIVLSGSITDQEFERIKSYLINPVEAREASMEKPASLALAAEQPSDVPVVEGFTRMSMAELENYRQQAGLAMSLEDLAFCQSYFRDEERRDPTLTEIRVLDTYWSDHCRHTTFRTKLENIAFEEGKYTPLMRRVYEDYLVTREWVYGEQADERDVCLMDLAVIGMKELKKKGLLEDLDESEEVNACSIVVDVDVDGRTEEWVVMFKNETHNHPTEIEPFGGAATCLGGAIRDPLSGRTYVYQAMRVTGSGDPRAKIEDTLPGKLPQRKITTGAAAGYSSYGNQVGLATGHVAEIYDEGYVAKRMEIGAVIAAAPRANIVRRRPQPGDVVVLVGGRTGRDGCGGATGSSKEHTTESLTSCGAEVQKGNPPTERKIQRLFRNPEVSVMIKKCNDFGAGGVSVAIGELTDGVEVNLDAIPKKYEGLDGTELAISESQERMAVVIAAEDVEAFVKHADAENLEATVVARVTATPRLRMTWRGKTIVDISREFLNTSGVKQKADVFVKQPEEDKNYFAQLPPAVAAKLDEIAKSSGISRSEEQALSSSGEVQLPAGKALREAWLANLQDLNVCSQRGLVERFDSTIGAGTVLMPFGGKYQDTPTEGMVAKIPLISGETRTATAMAFGYNPQLAKWSPFHGALYAVVEAVAKIVAMGGDYRRARLTLQEYFEKLGKDPQRWGKPFSALLGALHAQKQLGIPAIGGKDSMSGTFMDMHVPPTLVAFAVGTLKTDHVISPEFKQAGSHVVLVRARRDQNEVIDFDELRRNFEQVHALIRSKAVLAAHSVRMGGVAAALTKMAFGNRLGLKLEPQMTVLELFRPDYGSLILEIPAEIDLQEALGTLDYLVLGRTQEKPVIEYGETEISLEEALEAWQSPLEKIFPTKTPLDVQPQTISYAKRNLHRPSVKIAKPRVFIPVFPGTNCEYDSARAFERAGAVVNTLVIRNLTPTHVEETIQALVREIERAQIVMLPGGFSAGDEPDGSGKFIATMFRNPRIKEAIDDLLKHRDGLMLGICNGFQALIKLGLVPYGEIRDIGENSPTLTHNRIGRHVSCMVRTKVVSVLSPWFSGMELNEIHTIAVSHGEGRFVAKPEVIRQLIARGQVATQYVDLDGNPTSDVRFNPNGSYEAIEGITSPDGRVLGKMGHSERVGEGVALNIHGDKYQPIFEGGVNYFRG